MQRRQERKRLMRRALVLAVVGVLAGWTLIANYGATSLRIIAWRSVRNDSPNVTVSSVTYPAHFDKTFTDHRVVSEVQDQLDGAHLSLDATSGCAMGQVTYQYEFIFSTLGITTQIYTGFSGCPLWTAETFALWIPGVTPIPFAPTGNPVMLNSIFWHRLGVPLGGALSGS